jgi:hypothetical protein
MRKTICVESTEAIKLVQELRQYGAALTFGFRERCRRGFVDRSWVAFFWDAEGLTFRILPYARIDQWEQAQEPTKKELRFLRSNSGGGIEAVTFLGSAKDCPQRFLVGWLAKREKVEGEKRERARAAWTVT